MAVALDLNFRQSPCRPTPGPEDCLAIVSYPGNSDTPSGGAGPFESVLIGGGGDASQPAGAEGPTPTRTFLPRCNRVLAVPSF